MSVFLNKWRCLVLRRLHHSMFSGAATIFLWCHAAPGSCLNTPWMGEDGRKRKRRKNGRRTKISPTPGQALQSGHLQRIAIAARACTYLEAFTVLLPRPSFVPQCLHLRCTLTGADQMCWSPLSRGQREPHPYQETEMPLSHRIFPSRLHLECLPTAWILIILLFILTGRI